MRRAAFFDIDGTLVKCMTQKVLTKVLLQERLLNFFHVAQIYFWFLLSKSGLVKSSVELRKKVYFVFGSCKKAEMDTLFMRTYEKYIKKEIRSKMKEYVTRHIAAGDVVFAISGSLQALGKPICDEFGIENCFATNLTCSEDRYTGQWEGDILEGEEKAKLIKLLTNQHAIDLRKSAAYADSYSDVPMLEMVGEPIVVCPDHQLKMYAKQKGWKVIND